MSAYIDVGRRFQKLTDEELADPDRLSVLLDYEPYRGDAWENLLSEYRVVILAEAGSGKTREMQEQVKRLEAQGKPAFFLPIEALDREQVLDYLANEPGQAEKWQSWIGEAGTEGWVFLDSVDELKLASGKLDTALTKAAHALGPAKDRAHIVISCRPTDWQPVQDRETLESRLPVPQRVESSTLTSDEIFLAPFKREEKKKADQSEKSEPARTIQFVRLLPLSNKQISEFAVARGITTPRHFLEAINSTEAWPFARRPLDLSRLAKFWATNGTLGTLRDQHLADIDANLIEPPDRNQARQISPGRAREGVRSLALALMLNGSRTIAVPDGSLDGALATPIDARKILPTWQPDELSALLRLPIFDPATYGRVRFHHRSIQEFLIAEKLASLRASGLSVTGLFKQLFANTYDERVVIPTRRPVAAWLSYDDAEVAQETMQREPEVLVEYGDPASLPTQTRIELIRSYAVHYQVGGWRGLDLMTGGMARLAAADLADEIRALLSKPLPNEEVEEFLVKLIWVGAVSACADLAHKILMNAKKSSTVRVFAARALEKCNRTDLLAAAKNDLIAKPKRWPDRIVHAIADSLYPSVLSISELELLIRRTPEPKRSTGGFAWVLSSIAREINPESNEAIELRDLLTRLIWDERDANSEYYRLKSSFSYVAPALVRLCIRMLSSATPVTSDALRASAIALGFRGDEYVDQEDKQILRKQLSRLDGLRRELFLVELSIAENSAKNDDSWHTAHRLMHYSTFGNPTVGDWEWLLALLTHGRELEKGVCLEFLFLSWAHLFGRDAEKLEAIRTAIGTDKALVARLEQWLEPPKRNPELEKLEKENAKHTSKWRRKEEEIIESWATWKQGADQDPAACFAGEQAVKTMWILIRWLQQSEGRSRLALENWRTIRGALGDFIADGFVASVRKYWRDVAPPTWSSREPKDRNGIWSKQYAALTGLEVEHAVDPNWVRGLSKKAAQRAAEWGLVELNGFPEWYATLAQARPVEVAGALRTEVNAELALRHELAHPHTLSALAYGDKVFQELAAPALIDELRKWPTAKRSNTDAAVANLRRVLRVVIGSGLVDAKLAAMFERKFRATVRQPVASAWLQALCAIDLERGVGALRFGINEIGGTPEAFNIIRWFADIFGERNHEGVNVSIDVSAETLVDLTKLAYEAIRIDEDNQRAGMGVFSPDARDHAETARNRILSAIVAKPGKAGHDGLVTLSRESLFKHIPDRLRMLARRRAADDSEPVPISEPEILVFETRYENSPRNRDTLFEMIIDRLEDVEHHILHNDFGRRAILAGMKREKLLQEEFASLLEVRQRDHYQVVREPQVADNKLIDIFIVARSAPIKGVIELKLGDRWSLKDLEAAVDKQIVNQYLRHQSCQAGVLLVTYAGRKAIRDPVTHRNLDFDQVIARLREHALRVAQQNPQIRVAVYGIDLRSPLSASTPQAKRNSQSSGRRQKPSQKRPAPRSAKKATRSPRVNSRSSLAGNASRAAPKPLARRKRRARRRI